jgi:hypothetical protein
MNALQKLRESGRSVELLTGEKVKIKPSPPPNWIPRLKQVKPDIVAALKAEQLAAQKENLTEQFEERAAIAEYDGNLSREQAEELAVRTVWKWKLENGVAGTLHSSFLTYEETRKSVEAQFQRKVTHLEFISAMANGYGFVAYMPETGETMQ